MKSERSLTFHRLRVHGNGFQRCKTALDSLTNSAHMLITKCIDVADWCMDGVPKKGMFVPQSHQMRSCYGANHMTYLDKACSRSAGGCMHGTEYEVFSKAERRAMCCSSYSILSRRNISDAEDPASAFSFALMDCIGAKWRGLPNLSTQYA